MAMMESTLKYMGLLPPFPRLQLGLLLGFSSLLVYSATTEKPCRNIVTLMSNPSPVFQQLLAQIN